MEYIIVDVVRGLKSIREVEDRKRILKAQGKDYLTLVLPDFKTNILVIEKKK